MNIYEYIHIRIYSYIYGYMHYTCVYFIMVTKKRRGHGLERK